MNDDPVSLDARRGMSAQRETDVRRQLFEVQADQAALKARQQAFEDFLASEPATTQHEVAIKAKYLIQLYAATHEGSDPRRARLIDRALQELDQLFDLKPLVDGQ